MTYKAKITQHKFLLLTVILTSVHLLCIVVVLLNPAVALSLIWLLFLLGLVNVWLAWYCHFRLLSMHESAVQLATGCYLNSESLAKLHHKIKPEIDLPSMSGYSASPSALLYILELLDQHKPKTILELGAGVSSIVFGYWASRNGAKVFSLENDQEYARLVKGWLVDHGVDGFVSVINAALEPLHINNKLYNWYDRAVLSDLERIDFVFVDGPVGEHQKNARFPALPVLAEKLSEKSVIVLDDAARPDEQEILRTWRDLHPEMKYEYFPLDGKGLAYLGK